MGTSRGARCGRRADWAPEGRRLHLLDIENLCGGSHVGEQAVANAMTEYDEAVSVSGVDHTIVACSPQLVFPAKTARSGAQVLIGLGWDGADRALLEAVRVEDVASRFDEVVIGSGDHIFRALAIALRLSGLVVTVVSRASALSGDLARVAQKIVYIPELPQPSGEVSLRRVA